LEICKLQNEVAKYIRFPQWGWLTLKIVTTHSVSKLPKHPALYPPGSKQPLRLSILKSICSRESWLGQ